MGKKSASTTIFHIFHVRPPRRARGVYYCTQEDVDEDFEETLREICVELNDLNAESVTLAATIEKNLEELGIWAGCPRC